MEKLGRGGDFLKLTPFAKKISYAHNQSVNKKKKSNAEAEIKVRGLDARFQCFEKSAGLLYGAF